MWMLATYVVPWKQRCHAQTKKDACWCKDLAGSLEHLHYNSRQLQTCMASGSSQAAVQHKHTFHKLCPPQVKKFSIDQQESHH